MSLKKTQPHRQSVKHKNTKKHLKTLKATAEWQNRPNTNNLMEVMVGRKVGLLVVVKPILYEGTRWP